MAKADVKMPEDFLLKLSKLGDKTGRQLFCRQFAKLPCLPSLISLLSMI